MKEGMRDPAVEAEAPEQEATALWWWSLFNSADSAQMVCRADGSVQHINPKARRTFKLKAEPDGDEFSIYKILPAPAVQKLGRILRNRPGAAETIPSVLMVLDDASSLMMDLEIVPLAGGVVLLTFKDTAMR